jgi:hypothetical protein
MRREIACPRFQAAFANLHASDAQKSERRSSTMHMAEKLRNVQADARRKVCSRQPHTAFRTTVSIVSFSDQNAVKIMYEFIRILQEFTSSFSYQIINKNSEI